MTSPAERLIDTIRTAIAEGDHDRVAALVAPEVTLHTPRHLRPVTSRDHVLSVLSIVPKVVEGFHYSRWWAAGSEAIMEFAGEIDGVKLWGLDIFTVNDAGQITELTVFLRPTRAHAALAAAEDHLILADLARKAGGAAGSGA